MKVLAVRAYEKNLELLCDIDPAVPQRISGDPGRLRQVLLNLVANAIDAMPGGGKLSVASSYERGGGRVALQIADTGIGMSPERLARRVVRPWPAWRSVPHAWF